MSWTFEAEIWRYKHENPWHFVTLPHSCAIEITQLTEGLRKGFGSVRVEVRLHALGSDAEPSVWATSVFPDKGSGSYVLPVKKAVRKAHDLEDGDPAVVTLELATS